jgi:hypothetical protein
MKRYQEICRASQLPVLQNRVFHSEQEARNCMKGDVVLVPYLTKCQFNCVWVEYECI